MFLTSSSVFLTYPTFSSVAHLCNYPSNPLQIHLTSLELWNQYTHLGLISNEHNSRITLLFLKIAGKISKQRGTTLPHIISDAISYSRRVCLSKLQLTTSLQLFLTYKSSFFFLLNFILFDNLFFCLSLLAAPSSTQVLSCPTRNRTCTQQSGSAGS